jgi:putative ABC transport system permease protein
MVVGVVATFALAIGANAAMFGLVTRLMLPAPPGVTDAAQVARLTRTTSYPRYQELAAMREAFANVAATRSVSMIMGRGAEARAVTAVAATGNYFATLGARPALGRFFTPSDDEIPAGTPVAVLSHSFWRNRFGGERSAIDRSIELDGLAYHIVGVAQPGFSGDGISAVDVFVPMSVTFRTRPDWFTETRINLVSVIVRMQNGVTTSAAAGVADVELESLLPETMRNSPQARIARWLLGVSVIVLLIATANVGTLLLLRALRKRRDVAVRLALGATRRHLATHLTVESTLLALTGAAAGLVLSSWLSDVVRATLLPNLAPADRLADPVVLGLTLALALGAGITAGLAPLALVSQRMLTADLTVGSGSMGTVARSRMQRLLVGLQVALCTVLLVGAGLFVRSLQRVQGQELGFSTAHLLLVRLDFREQLGGSRQDQVHRELLERVATLPGVTGATIIQATPFGHHSTPPVSVPGLQEPPNAGGQLATMYAATPDYLRLMDVRLLQGRLFTDEDRRGSPLVVLVNETFAREVWPNERALGKCVRAGHDPYEEPSGGMASPSLPCRTVVGVVRDSRVRSLRPVNREATLMQYYVPFEQQPGLPFFVNDPSTISGMLVGVAGDPADMASTVQRLIQASSVVPVYARVQPYQELLDPQLRPWRLGATLFVAFGSLALVIAAVGLFGVISYLVSQRTREIGLRLALGGTGAVVRRTVIASALKMVSLGLGLGMVAALAAGPSAQDLLFQTAPYDAGVLVAAAGTLLFVTIVSAAIPAWRAARVSPMVALRVE